MNYLLICWFVSYLVKCFVRLLTGWPFIYFSFCGCARQIGSRTPRILCSQITPN